MQIPLHKLLFSIAMINLLTACSSGSKFASSFGKRKYTRGYFVDNPSSVKTESRITVSENSNRDITRGNQLSANNNAIRINNNSIDTIIKKPHAAEQGHYAVLLNTLRKQAIDIHKKKLATAKSQENSIANPQPIENNIAAPLYQRPSDSGAGSSSSLGTAGLIISLLAILCVVIAVILLYDAAHTSYNSSYYGNSSSNGASDTIGAVLLFLLAFILWLTGLIICIVAVANGDHGAGSVGMIIDLVLLLLVLLGSAKL